MAEERLVFAHGTLGQIAKYDSEYERRGTANIFMAVEPLAGKRTVQITDQRTRTDWALFIRDLLLTVYPEKVLLRGQKLVGKVA